MDNHMYSEDAYQSNPKGDEPSTDITLDKIGLYKGRNFCFIIISEMIGCSLLRYQKSVEQRRVLSHA